MDNQDILHMFNDYKNFRDLGDLRALVKLVELSCLGDLKILKSYEIWEGRLIRSRITRMDIPI